MKEEIEEGKRRNYEGENVRTRRRRYINIEKQRKEHAEEGC